MLKVSELCIDAVNTKALRFEAVDILTGLGIVAQSPRDTGISLRTCSTTDFCSRVATIFDFPHIEHFGGQGFL